MLLSALSERCELTVGDHASDRVTLEVELDVHVFTLQRKRKRWQLRPGHCRHSKVMGYSLASTCYMILKCGVCKRTHSSATRLARFAVVHKQ